METWTSGLVGVSLGPRGRYRLQALIDEGGMAAVFEAADANLRRTVALKLIRPALCEDRGFARRFEREAHLVAGLDHPHILPVYDFGETEAGEATAPAGLLYLVMRLVRGLSLRGVLSSGSVPLPWTPQQALALARQLLPALEYAHRRGVVHRDFKPENVLIEDVTGGYHAFLADFGLARAAEPDLDQSRLTQTGQIMGTPFYMAPEQWLGELPDPRTDEYAVGVLLYELLTGEVPYQASMPMAVGQKHLEARLPPPRSKNPAIPDAVAQVVVRALARDPGQRYATCADLLTALATAVEHDPSRTIVQPIPPIPPPPPAPTLRPVAPTLLKAVAGGVAAVLALILMARAAGWFEPGRSDPTPTPVVALGTPGVPSAGASLTVPVAAGATSVPSPASPGALGSPGSPAPIARAEPTTTLAARATVTRTPTAQPTPPVASGNLGTRGTLRQPDTIGPTGLLAGVHYRNTVTEVRIENPRDSSGRPLLAWDHGLALRYTEQVGEYRLFITSAATWTWQYVTLGQNRAPGITRVSSGALTNLNTAPDGANVLRVVAIEHSGYFFLNDTFISRLELSADGDLLDSGDVAVASGYVEVNRVVGATTNYTAFTVSPFTYYGDTSATPTPYALTVRPGSGYDSDSAQVKAHNVVVFASFLTPSVGNAANGKWDFGFVFRKVRQAEAYRLVLTADDNKWWLRRIHHDGPVSGDPTPTTADYRAVADGTFDNLETATGRYNDLLLMAIGNTGYVFLNNRPIGRLNISENTMDGDVEVGSGFFAEYANVARTLTYDSFRVWTAAP